MKNQSNIAAIFHKCLIMFLLLVTGFGSAAAADFQAYSISGGPIAGNQAFTGSLGNDFNVVNSPITITALGAFDDDADGIIGFINVYIYDLTDTNSPLASVTITGAADPLMGQFRFQDIAPLILGPGTYSVVAFFSNSNDKIGNENAANIPLVTDNGGGLVSFENGRSGPYDPTVVFPTGGQTVGVYNCSGQPEACFAAGSFKASGDPDTDGDGVPDDIDNCRFVANEFQEDLDEDGVGDACEGDAPPPLDGFGVRETFAITGNENAIRAVRDMDNDGIMDVVMSRFSAGRIGVLEKQGGALVYRFELLQNQARAVHVGEVDGDSTPEFAFGALGGPWRIFESNGDNSYVERYSAVMPVAEFTVSGDADVDGNFEFIVAEETGFGAKLRTFEAQSDNVYVEQTAIGPFGHVNGYVAGPRDLDGDGIPEILFHDSLSGPGNTRVFEAGSQIFLVPGMSGTSLGDTDGNGLGEFLGRDTSGNLRIYESTGSGNGFQLVFIDPAPGYSAFAIDVDFDGHSELVKVQGNTFTLARRVGNSLVEVYQSGTLLQDSAAAITQVLPIEDTNGNGIHEVAVLQGLRIVILDLLVVDSDGDGVNDLDDLCPLTAAGATVDANGCADYEVDTDGDGICDSGNPSAGPSGCTGSDNCPLVENNGQEDADADGFGDACDSDDDNDLVPDGSDNCPLTLGGNADQTDTDLDGAGDICDADLDGDGVDNIGDVCPNNPDPDQTDTDGDLAGDACDINDDGDDYDDVVDNCPLDVNNGQEDLDGDNIGDACDADLDGDGVNNNADNCPVTLGGDANQTDTDLDGEGDVCDTDDDNDTILDGADNCPLAANTSQGDADGDGIGDACNDADDADGDEWSDTLDNCPNDANGDQADLDFDLIGDACDPDVDGDGVENVADNCAATPLGELSDASGCTIAQLCPCDGPQGTTSSWKNRGKYVSCVAHAANNFRDASLISDAEHGDIVSAATQSACGVKVK